ncbi:tyrosine-type recombinase/integrase [Leeia sp. TBRC 13508]|uniref:Tyrosine-type recombinase/integrase n=1 Tax=Leeia speluncae TaxID=2884804 RepID=A0ABS8D2E5_9NEIS|nr:site-specific integrase [Leeia speluncae]MCB6182370.1 tyrosine-type recombinase/integrase [Leeia speluncae]
MGQNSSKITVKQLENLSDADDGRVLREVGGLVGKVRAGTRGISVLFRYEYSQGGKKMDCRLGAWPKKSLADIRVERDRLKPIAQQGINLNAAKKAQSIEAQAAVAATIAKAEQERVASLTVEDLFNSWIVDGVARKDGNAELRRRFAKDVLPQIGQIVLGELQHSDILSVLRKQMGRGVVRLAVSTFTDISQMMAWAEKRKPWRPLLTDGNPCDLVEIRKLLPEEYEEERDRVLSGAEIRELAEIFKKMDSAYEGAPNKRLATRPVDKKTRFALWISLGTLCRIGELLMARWEHVNLETGVWFIPRENVKGVRGKKHEHYIFLSNFARHQFAELHKLTGSGEWCFPAKNTVGVTTHVCLKTVSKQVGDRQICFKNRNSPLKARAFDNSLVLSRGANGEWTPHDLRRTGATMMQALGVSLDVIDRCQNHIITGSKVRRHYLHHDYSKEKSEAWNLLGNRINEILSEDTFERTI